MLLLLLVATGWSTFIHQSCSSRYLWFPNLIIAAVKDFQPVSELRPQTLLKIKEDKK